MPQRGEKRAVVQHAETNAREALERRLAETAGQAKLLEATAELFGLPAPPERIEVYDNSHIMGANAYGVMIVAGPEGFMKKAYRKFAIRGPITPGDDFAMMREVLERRFGRALQGACRRRRPALARPRADRRRRRAAIGRPRGAGRSGRERREAGRHRQGAGPRRRAGVVPHRRASRRSSCRRATRCCISCNACATRRIGSPSPPTAPGEAAAISRASWTRSPASAPARKRALLNHFGSARGVKQAGLADLDAVPGINRETARRVYAHFHPGVRMEGVS